jgi:hypothetical protein
MQLSCCGVLSQSHLIIVFKSLCELLRVSVPFFLVEICLPKGKWCAKSKVKVNVLH